MYLKHFGLDQAPFRITPNTGFFFAGANRGATLEALAFAVLHDEGIVKVSGEVGTGKTMLCRMLIAQLPATADSLFLANPTLGPDDLLRQIADELGIYVASGNAGALLMAIQQGLIERFALGRRVVALVDEAHAMPAASLEQIRLLSNLETGNQKLLQIVLFGQPELDEILARRGMRQLKDRITHHFRLDPLGPAETARYLDFRLRAAGYRGPELFGGSAARLIARASNGLSRRINILADKALLAVFAEGSHQVKRRHVLAAIRDSEYPMPHRRLAWTIAGATLAAALAAGLAWWQIAAAPPGARADVSAPAPAPTDPPPARTSESSAAPSSTATPDVATPVKAVAPPPAPADGETLPVALGPIARAHLAGTAEWVRSRPADHWFIQLHTVDRGQPADIETYLQRILPELDPAQLRLYVRTLEHGVRTGVIYGDYATRQQALAAHQSLPAGLRAGGAYLRQIRGLQ